MLGKLLKYDFRACKMVIPFYLISIALGAILMGMVAFGVFPTNNYVLGAVGGILSFFLVMSGMAIMVVSVVSVILHFGKQTIGAQGQIMFTLPVTSGQFLASKLISGTTILFAAIAYFWGGMLLFAYSSTQGNFTITNDFWFLIAVTSGVIVIMLLSLVFSQLLVYASIGVSGYLSQNRVLGSIVAYIVLSFVIQLVLLVAVAIIASIIMFFLTDGFAFTPNPNEVIQALPIIAFSVTTVFIGIADAIMFLICKHLYTKKLNLP